MQNLLDELKQSEPGFLQIQQMTTFINLNSRLKKSRKSINHINPGSDKKERINEDQYV